MFFVSHFFWNFITRARKVVVPTTSRERLNIVKRTCNILASIYWFIFEVSCFLKFLGDPGGHSSNLMSWGLEQWDAIIPYHVSRLSLAGSHHSLKSPNLKCSRILPVLRFFFKILLENQGKAGFTFYFPLKTDEKNPLRSWPGRCRISCFPATPWHWGLDWPFGASGAVAWRGIGREGGGISPLFGGFPDIFLEELAKMTISSSGG